MFKGGISKGVYSGLYGMFQGNLSVSMSRRNVLSVCLKRVCLREYVRGFRVIPGFMSVGISIGMSLGVCPKGYVRVIMYEALGYVQGCLSVDFPWGNS